LPDVDDADAIQSLIHSYAELLDAGDLDGVAALFEHATWRSSSRTDVLRGAQQVREAYHGVILYDGVPRTRHVISNVTVVCDDAPVATARCYFTVLQAVPGLALQPILAGQYHDEFERVDGQWRFTDRVILPDLIGDLSHHMRRPDE
jgi:3-phenylpropionate/cinnamic acid dioxygenase small subunit